MGSSAFTPAGGAVSVTGTAAASSLAVFSTPTSITAGNLSGDVTTSGTPATTVVAVHGVSYGTNPSTNTVPVVTGSNVVTYEAVPNAALANSSVTLNAVSSLTGGGAVALGSAISVGIGTGSANTLAGYNNTGVFSGVSIGSNLTLSSGTLSATAGGGAVSSVFGRTGTVTSQWNDYQFNLVGGTASVSQGGTGQTSLTSHAVLLGEGAVTGVGFATTGTAGRLLLDQGGIDPSFQIMSGDASLASTGAITFSTVNSNTGSFGSSTSIPNFTVNGKGLITAAGGNTVIAPAGTLTGTTLASNVTASSLTTVGALASGSLVTGFSVITNALLANSSLTVSGVSGVTGGGSVALGSAITLGMAGNTANTLAGYNNNGAFSDVAIGSNLSLVGGTLVATAGTGAISNVFGRTGAITAQWNDYQFNLVGGTAAVSQGGTGQTSLTSHAVLLGEGAVTGVGFATIGTAGRLLFDQGNVDPAFEAVSGDVSAVSTGAFTVLAVHGVTYPASPSTNTIPVVTSSNTVTYTSIGSNLSIASNTLSANPGGSNTQLQYNHNTLFGGVINATSDGSNLFVVTQSTSDNSTKAASTAYVTTAITNAIAGVNPAVAVVVATTQASDTSGLTYNNGAAGIGATLTGSNNTALTFDGVTLTSLTQRVLVKNDTQSPSGAFNGIYTLTQLQTAILPPILTRALDFDQSTDINSTGAIPVTSGTVNASTSWVVTSTVNTVGTDPITFTKFSLNPTTIITNSTAAGGSLTGTYPNPTIANSAVSNAMLVNSSVIVSGVSGVTGGGTVTLGSSITLGMANNSANTLAGYNSSGVFSDVAIGTALSLSSGTLNSTGVSLITNADSSLTISPNTGNVTASLNVTHANTWTATQTSAVSGGVSSFITTGSLEFSIFANGNSGAGTPTLKWDNGNIQSVTITGACTLGFTNPTHPSRLTVISTMSATSNFSYAYSGTVLWPGGIIPSLSSVTNAIDITSFLWDGSQIYGVANTGFAI